MEFFCFSNNNRKTIRYTPVHEIFLTKEVNVRSKSEDERLINVTQRQVSLKVYKLGKSCVSQGPYK